MLHKKRLIFSLLIGMLLPLGLHAQDAVTAAGGDASGSGGSASYSVGQVVYTTNTGTSNSVAQGVQQAYEISNPTGLAEASGILLEVSAFPNPTTDQLTLTVGNYTSINLSYQLFDVSGKMVQTDQIIGNSATLSMLNLAPAHYFLKVLDAQKEIKTFQIIKGQ